MTADSATREEISFPPTALHDRLQEILSADRLQSFLSAATSPRKICLRVNPLRSTVDDIREQLQHATIGFRPVAWCEHAFETDSTARVLQELPAWRNGAFHIQSLSSIAATLALDPQPGERILDMCAAPGSKTSHIGALMNNEGELVANDLSRARCHRLRAVLKQMGVRAQVRSGPGEKIGHRYPASFDRILVDVPCSGEGRMRRDNPDSFSTWRTSLPKRLSSRQKSLLHSAIDGVRPGGTIVYSTCTFAPEENELVLARALERYGDQIELEPIPIEIPGALAPVEEFNGRTIMPMPHALRLAPPQMDGFFIARLRRLA